MVVQALAAQHITDIAGKAGAALNTPVIGRKTITVKQTAKGMVTTETSFQLRAWELGAVAAGAGFAWWMYNDGVLNFLTEWKPGAALEKKTGWYFGKTADDVREFLGLDRAWEKYWGFG